MKLSFPHQFFTLPLGCLLLALPTARAEVAPAPRAGITVEARGPIHEAFAAPVTAAPQAGLIVAKQPPAPIPEEPPEQKPAGESVLWVPGYWAWDTDRNDFLWISGLWRVPPTGRRWVPGYWNKVADGFQWVSGFWAPEAVENLSYLPEPPASQDNGPNAPAPDADSNWVPGNWVWRNGQFVWQPGYWLGQQEGRVWTPATYSWTPCGYVYINGYWDYPLANRGLLFAPVVFTQPLWTDPNWVYTPSFCVDVPGLLSCLWVRPSYGHYYFGDYYGPAYGRLGFSPWLSYGPRRYDPLYGYYGWRNGPGFVRNLNALNAGRISGDLARPGRTLAEQNNIIASNPGVQRTVNSFAQVARGGTVRMTNLTAAQRTQERQLAQSFHEVRQERTIGEQKAARGANPLTAQRGSAPPATSLRLPASAHTALKTGTERPASVAAHEVHSAAPAATHTPAAAAHSAPATHTPAAAAPRTTAKPVVHTTPAARPATHATPRPRAAAARPAPKGGGRRR